MVGISTSSSISFFYTLLDFLDSREGQPLDELVYENAEFINCSVNSFSVTQLLNGSASVEVISGQVWRCSLQVIVACNTTANQVITLVGSEQDNNANAGVRTSHYDILSLLSQVNTTEPLNVTQAIQVFYFAAVFVTGFLLPVNGVGKPSSPSILLPSLRNNYSSISISYPGSSARKASTDEQGLI
jgi:hypothetical protein